MSEQAIWEALSVWREGDRLLEELPPLSPDHESVARAVASARLVYVALTSEAEATDNILRQSRQLIEDSQRTIDEARQRRESEHAA